MPNSQDFRTIIRSMLMETAENADGKKIQIDGRDATYLEVLCKQILNKSFNDANLGWRVLVHAGVIPEDKGETMEDFLNG